MAYTLTGGHLTKVVGGQLPAQSDVLEDNVGEVVGDGKVLEVDAVEEEGEPELLRLVADLHKECRAERAPVSGVRLLVRWLQSKKTLNLPPPLFSQELLLLALLA